MSLTAELISEIDERTERISQDQRRMNRIISYHVRSAIAEERIRGGTQDTQPVLDAERVALPSRITDGRQKI